MSNNEDMVTLTIRIPEQFFEREVTKAEWGEMSAGNDNDWTSPGYVLDWWRSDIDPDDELYGPDGQQVPWFND
jgi:hypothetical protein